MSVESSSGAVFDAIVFGETRARTMDGRQQRLCPHAELSGPARERGDRTRRSRSSSSTAPIASITAYRNGQPYGKPYQSPLRWPTSKPGKSHVLFGLRHSPAGGNRHSGRGDRTGGAVRPGPLGRRSRRRWPASSASGSPTTSCSRSCRRGAHARRRELTFDDSRRLRTRAAGSSRAAKSMPSFRARPSRPANWSAAIPHRRESALRPGASARWPPCRPISAWRPTPPSRSGAASWPSGSPIPNNPLDAARDRQSPVALPLRRRPGRYAQRLRLQRRPPLASRNCSTGWPPS